jgi:hypothetical protein
MPRLSTTVTQGGADAFAVAELPTALTGIRGTAFRVLRMGYEFTLPAVPNFPIGAAAAQELELALSRRTKAAMPNANDVDVIQKWKWASPGRDTAVGYGPVVESAGVIVPGEQLLIVEDPIFALIDSTGTTGTWAAVVWFDYEAVRISDIDRLTLLTQSLEG